MKIEPNNRAYAYYRLSREEIQNGESASITNQRMIVERYCKNNGLTILDEFVDDGFSGGNFDRPGFQKMMNELSKGMVKIVITKDLSRLGRGLYESGYYIEQFFPENGIRYIAIDDHYDSLVDNKLVSFQLAMNDFYLRDGSAKVKSVLKSKREQGQYAACPPYGYKKDPQDNNKLVPDENTAPIVKRIFDEAASGKSSHQIADGLNRDGIIPPLKYRVLHRDKFSAEGALRMSDKWNHTTIKRYLKNKVYLGHTILGKTKKTSVRSKKKQSVPESEWAITYNTHEALVDEFVFEMAQKNLAKGTKDYRKHDHVRKSIFAGVAYCALCGHALCSCGSVYKGEREKYWYLSCINKRKDAANPCTGARIKYSDLVELITDELNAFITLDNRAINRIVDNLIKNDSSAKAIKARKRRKEQLEARLNTIDNMTLKLYSDNAEGKIDDSTFNGLLEKLQVEANGIKNELQSFKSDEDVKKAKIENYQKFFELTKKYSRIEELDRDTLLTFVERIEVGPKILPDGRKRATHTNSLYEQSIRIFYKFIGEAEDLS